MLGKPVLNFETRSLTQRPSWHCFCLSQREKELLDSVLLQQQRVVCRGKLWCANAQLVGKG